MSLIAVPFLLVLKQILILIIENKYQSCINRYCYLNEK